jgi:hypothetical protein
MALRREMRALAVLFVAFVVASPVAIGAQGSDIDTREMNASTFFRGRPKSRRGGPPAERRYRRAGVKSPTAPVSPPAASEAVSDAEVGFTIWRLRPPMDRDPVDTRDITHSDDGPAIEWVAERVAGGLELSVGQRFRFAIETPRKGYLYVVNRPHYEDGPRDPVLVFPTSKIRGGANEVEGGRLVELPSRWDRRPYFEITKRGERRLVAEEVIVLVTPKPLDLRIEEKPLSLTDAQVEAWEKRWGALSEAFELVGGEGMTYTVAERTAGADTNRFLTQEDPGPQTIYRIATKAGDPIFLRVIVRIRDEGAAIAPGPNGSE